MRRSRHVSRTAGSRGARGPASSLAERLTRPRDGTGEGSPLPRILAAVAVIAAIVLVALLLFGSGSGYKVSAVFPTAGQLVVGNNVDVQKKIGW